ncbi:MAG TPA: DUF2249 domain-containing protein [Longimicrobiales bacterium]
MITKDDRVAAVLKENEALIDVFTSLSPAFERLRNPAMRKVMARLVTVEQAARMAGVDSDTLVSRLNDGAPAADESVPVPVAEPLVAARPAALDAIPAERVVVVDVRDDLRRGQEPFSRIMAAKASVPAGGALSVRAIFEPVPLYAVMKKQGLAHYTERHADDDWQVWFYPAAAEAPQPAASVSASRDDDAGPSTDSDDDVVVLDVRGLEPPEPMMRTLAALESLPDGATLVQINVRVPRFLLPLLEERGFGYEVREQGADLVRLFIRRNGR